MFGIAFLAPSPGIVRFEARNAARRLPETRTLFPLEPERLQGYFPAWAGGFMTSASRIPVVLLVVALVLSSTMMGWLEPVDEGIQALRFQLVPDGANGSSVSAAPQGLTALGSVPVFLVIIGLGAAFLLLRRRVGLQVLLGGGALTAVVVEPMLGVQFPLRPAIPTPSRAVRAAWAAKAAVRLEIMAAILPLPETAEILSRQRAVVGPLELHRELGARLPHQQAISPNSPAAMVAMV